MKYYLAIFFTAILTSAFGQNNDLYRNLNIGTHYVGFKEIKVKDYSRIYKDDFRTVQIALWYPVKSNNEKKVRLIDYLDLYNTEDEFEDSVDIKEFWGKQFKRVNSQTSIDKIFEAEALAYFTPLQLDDDYPLILYAAGGQGESFENFLICEILASNGFIVAAIPSIGTYIHPMEINVDGLMTQTYDIQVALRYLNQQSFIDTQNIGTYGWSWGGLSAFYFQAIYPKIGAFVSLDGSIAGYRDVLEKLPYYGIEKMTAPSLFFTTSQDTKIRTIKFLEEAVYTNSTFVSLDSIEHSDFNSYSYLAQIFADIEKNKSITYFYPFLINTVADFFIHHLKIMNKAPFEIEKKLPLIDSTFFYTGIEPPLREDQLISLILAKSANDALLEYRKMKRLNPTYIPFKAFELTKVAFTLVRDSVRSDESLTVMEIVLQEYPESASSYALRGRIYEIRGENQQALYDFKKALLLKEGHPKPEEVVFYEDIDWYKKKIQELEKK